MIRLFIFVLIRFFMIALVFYAALTLLKKVIQALQGHSRPNSDNSQQEKHPKPAEDYKDVKDAKFVELPDKQAEKKQDSSS
jgi:flagellar basal body-associated protein FliL